MKITITETSYAKNIDNWSYIYYNLMDPSGDIIDKVYTKIEELKINSQTNSSVELLVYNLNLQEIPRVMNIMSKQSSYGLDKIIGIKSKFELKDSIDDVPDTCSGSIVKFYFPNFYYDGENRIPIELAVPDKVIPTGSMYCKEILILDSDKNKSDPIARIYGESDSSISNRIYGVGEDSQEDIIESSRKRSLTVLMTSGGNTNNISEVATHLSQEFNEHQGQSGLTVGELRKGKYISKIFQDILSNDRRLTCNNGVVISSEFTKFYIGTYTGVSSISN